MWAFTTETEFLFKDIVYTAPPPPLPLADNAQRPNS
jgi:hypothetical protein